MLYFTRNVTVVLLMFITSSLFSQTINTRSFHKVIVSPYIESTFVQGDKEQVVINSSSVAPEKLHIEASNGTLRIYLEGAKVVPHGSRDGRRNGYRPLYSRHAVTATIYYKKLDALSLRGEEQFTFDSPLSAKRFNLKLYGEPAITFTQVDIDDLRATLYGEGSLEMQSGSVNKQTYTCYGEGKVNMTAIASAEAKLTAYGEAEFSLNVSDRIRITSFGEATLRYKGNAQVVKAVNVGGVDVARLD